MKLGDRAKNENNIRTFTLAVPQSASCNGSQLSCVHIRKCIRYWYRKNNTSAVC